MTGGAEWSSHWPWFLLLAAVFAAIPWVVSGVSGPLVLAFVCGVISAKWFLFGAWGWTLDD